MRVARRYRQITNHRSHSGASAKTAIVNASPHVDSKFHISCQMAEMHIPSRVAIFKIRTPYGSACLARLIVIIWIKSVSPWFGC